MKTIESMPILTVDFIEGSTFIPIGSVFACCCLSKSIVGDVFASIKNWSVGGELPGYTKMLEKATESIYDRIREKAIKMNADAVIGFRLTTSDVSAGAAEIIGYGTAVKLKLPITNE
ncbi:MAG: YbjQ family protein [Candidatus Hydrogenedentes bacterium]|jgi:uncharacterized protein YbjQ (UPF0145 family)|nr:YbjQ family protein [Candidatus Hydrogenedentota bacterium]